MVQSWARESYFDPKWKEDPWLVGRVGMSLSKVEAADGRGRT